jgi:hypothetical protein
MYTRHAADVLLSVVLSVGLALLVVSGVPVRVYAGVDTVTLSDPGSYGEDDDYFTTVWGNPRDMDGPGDLYLLNSSCGSPPARAKWSSSTFSEGIWRGVTGDVGESRYVYLLNPGWVSSLDTGEDGELRPIDTTRYRQLTFRMRVESGAGLGDPRVEWGDGPIGVSSSKGRRIFQSQGDGKWHIYTFDLGSDGAWSSSAVTALWFQFESLSVGKAIEIDWVRLTPIQNRRVEWTGNSLSGRTATVYLMPGPSYSTQYGDVLIFDGFTPSKIDAQTQALDVPASFPGGTYRARVVAGPSGLTSGDSWTFVQVPLATIRAPSYTSGEDFATSVVGNPWDMSGLDDVDIDTTEMDDIRSLGVANGVLTIVARDDGMGSCAAPWPHRPLGLNLGGQQIDTAKYRYMSWRYKVDNVPDQGAGGVHRIRWQARQLKHWPTGRTDDISLYDAGWRTYHLDLPNVVLEVEGGKWGDFPVDVLQVIIHESHREWASHLDWVKLTAENVAQDSYTVRWSVIDAGLPLTTTLYWAEKDGPSFRLVPGTGRVIPPSEPGGLTLPYDHNLFLPALLREYNPAHGGQFQHEMSTAGLTNGKRYYVALKLEDGYNATWRYSEVPVLKQ